MAAGEQVCSAAEGTDRIPRRRAGAPDERTMLERLPAFDRHRRALRGCWHGVCSGTHPPDILSIPDRAGSGSTAAGDGAWICSSICVSDIGWTITLAAADGAFGHAGPVGACPPGGLVAASLSLAVLIDARRRDRGPGEPRCHPVFGTEPDMVNIKQSIMVVHITNDQAGVLVEGSVGDLAAGRGSSTVRDRVDLIRPPRPAARRDDDGRQRARASGALDDVHRRR